MSLTDFMIGVENHHNTIKAEHENPKLKLMEDEYSKLELEIINLLTENTGTHILDSGGVYGRHWQTNRKIANWNDKPYYFMSGSEWIDKEGKHNLEVLIYIDLYNFLTERLEIDENTKVLRKLWDQFIETPAEHDLYWYQNIENFMKHLKDLGLEVTGIYGYGDPFSFNTYNEENDLTQDFQAHYFEVTGTLKTTKDTRTQDTQEIEFYEDPFIILETHNGADIKGGYTDPRIFKTDDGIFNYSLMDKDLNLYCPKCKTRWIRENWQTHRKEKEIPTNQYNLNGERIPPQTIEEEIKKYNPANKDLTINENDKPICLKCNQELEISFY